MADSITFQDFGGFIEKIPENIQKAYNIAYYARCIARERKLDEHLRFVFTESLRRKINGGASFRELQKIVETTLQQKYETLSVDKYIEIANMQFIQIQQLTASNNTFELYQILMKRQEDLEGTVAMPKLQLFKLPITEHMYATNPSVMYITLKFTSSLTSADWNMQLQLISDDNRVYNYKHAYSENDFEKLLRDLLRRGVVFESNKGFVAED